MGELATTWWKPGQDPIKERDDRDRAVALLQETSAIEMRQSSWHELNLWNTTLFTNRELVGFRWGAIQGERELWPMTLRTENIIEQIGSAMVSKASTSPLRPSIVPHGKSYKTERAVRLMDEFLFGVWMQTKSEEACIAAFLDSFLSGIGCVRVAWDDIKKTIHTESVFFDNIIIDNRECANRATPRTYRVRQVMPRAHVEARYGVTLDPQGRYVDYRAVGDGWVVLVEAWHLPDENGEGGRHTVACTEKLLVDEPWNEPWVPLVFFHWTDLVSGWFCKSGVEQLVPYQVRQNELNDAIELSQDIACRARLLVHANSSIDVSQWDNEAGRFLMYAGVKPEPFIWPTNLAELYNQRIYNRQSAFSFMGLSEMSVQADLPDQVRLDSSAGVREFQNMEDRSHLRLWTRWQHFRLDVARTLLRVLSIHKGARAYTAVYHPGASRAAAKSIPYDAVRTLTEDEYSWTLEAVPLSAMSPAARRELIRDWSSRGLIDQNEARRMEGNPNLERIEDMEVATQDDVLRHLGILEDGGYEAPDEKTNLTYGVPKVRENLARLKTYEDVEQIVLDNHDRWLLDAMNVQQAASPPQPSAMTPFAPSQGIPGTNAAQGPVIP